VLQSFAVFLGVRKVALFEDLALVVLRGIAFFSRETAFSENRLVSLQK
jgi:hypothetical protein